MKYSLKKLSKTFDQKLTNLIQNVIRIGFLSIFYIPAGGSKLETKHWLN